MAKKRNRRLVTRRRLKWVGTFVFLLVLGVYVNSNWNALSVTRMGTQRVATGRINYGRFTCEWFKMTEPELTPRTVFFNNRQFASGIAFGFDRWIMMLSGSESLRDVVAFPKTQRAVCPMTDAPSAVSQDQLDELNLSLKLPKK